MSSLSRKHTLAKSDRDDNASDNNDHDNTDSRHATYIKDNCDINKRVNNECDNTDRYHPSTGATTPSTNENIIDHEPAEFAVALSDPPTAADPELHHAFQNLDDLHSEMKYLLRPSDTFPSSTRKTSGATSNASWVHDDNENEDQNYDNRNNEDRRHDNHNKEDRNSDYCATNNRGTHDNDGNDECVTEERHNNDRANDQGTNDDHTPTPAYPTPLKRQSSPPLYTQQRACQPDTAPSAMPLCGLETTQPDPAKEKLFSPNDTNSPRPTPLDDKSDATLQKLWILLKQLEEINIQFALLLDILAMTPKPSLPPSNHVEGYSQHSDAPTAPRSNNVTTLAMPKMPPPTESAPTSPRMEPCRTKDRLQVPAPPTTSPDKPTKTTQPKPPPSTTLPAPLTPNLDHDTHHPQDIMSLLTYVDEKCAELEKLFAQLDNVPGRPTTLLHDGPLALSTPCNLPSIPMPDLTLIDTKQLRNQPTTFDPNPLGQQLMRQLPSDTPTLTLRTPPWPPPMPSMDHPITRALPWYYTTQTTNLILTPTTCVGTIMPQRPNSTFYPNAPNLTQTQVLPGLLQLLPPRAIPCPPHQQAPFKIQHLANPCQNLPSRLLPPTTRRIKANLHPP